MKIRNVFFNLLLVVLCIAFFKSHRIFAETGCSGPTYGDDQMCGGDNVNCPLSACQDQSAESDGTLYQCCPPGVVVAEYPSQHLFFWLSVFLVSVSILVYKKRKKAALQ